MSASGSRSIVTTTAWSAGVAALGTSAAFVLTLVAIEFSIRREAEFVETIVDHRTAWVVAAVVFVVAQAAMALPVVAVAAACPADRRSVGLAGAALVGVGATLQIGSALVNVVLGADLAPDAVAGTTDLAVAIAAHDVADAGYFAAFSLVGVGVGLLGRAATPTLGPAVGRIGAVAAVANLAVYLAFAAEALAFVGIVGVAAVAVWFAVVAHLLGAGEPT